MSDEQFMRVWNTGHSRFSADLHHHLRRLRRQPVPGPVSAAPIGKTYENNGLAALLRGFGASVITTALFLGGIVAVTAQPVDPATLVQAMISDGAQPAGRVELA